VVEGFFKDSAELEQYAADLAALEIDRRRRDIAWRLGLGEDILDDRVRLSELAHLARR
jgi:GMP synthase (glutamine-hydrolysing)